MSSPAPERRENLWLNLLCNVAAPAFILSKFSTPDRLGPQGGLVVALSLPLAYGLYDFARRRKANFFSVVGFVSTLLTGGLGLLAVGRDWFAVKEAAVPFLFGLAVLLSAKSRTPLVRTMLYSDQVIDVPKVDAALAERGNQYAFQRLLGRANLLVALSFFVSAALNFVLAKLILKSPPGTTEFAQELGRMTALSWPVIVIPSLLMMMATLWLLLRGVRALTGLSVEEVFRGQEKRA